ncbi:MAG: hypothetical protein U9N49_07570 [Campylobacterota bacterium]|nr:hypothetical protein [Campylobacterota bacterium]
MNNKGYLGGVISLLLGLSIGFTALSFIYTLLSYTSQGFFQAILFAFFAMIPGLLVIVLLEFVLLGYQKYEESAKQTKVLEEILKELQAQKAKTLAE